MKEQSENRRVRMTKQLLKDALMELLEQKELTSITVTAICERADVHRSTFYKYYTDPADLMRDIEQDFLKMIPMPNEVPEQQDREQLLAETTAFFDKVKLNRKAFRILFGKSTGNSFTIRLVDYLCSGNFPVGKGADELSERYLHLYIACGTVGMLREWIETDFVLSSRRIAEMMFYYSRRVTS